MDVVGYALANAIPATYANPSDGFGTDVKTLAGIRSHIRAVTYNGLIYLRGGTTDYSSSYGSMVTETVAYDPVANTLTSKAAQACYRGSAFGVIGGSLFEAGGLSGTSMMQDVAEYNFAGNGWGYRPAMPSAAAKASPASAVINGLLYVAGGGNGYLDYAPSYSTNTNYSYDPSGDVWTAKASAPVRFFNGPSGANVGGKLLVAGGNTSPDGSADSGNTQAYLYDPTANTWARTGDVPAGALTPGYGFAPMVATNGGALLTHGATGAFYDPQTGTWTRLHAFAGGFRTRYRTALATLDGATFYLIGGTNADDNTGNNKITSGVPTLPKPTGRKTLLAYLAAK